MSASTASGRAVSSVSRFVLPIAIAGAVLLFAVAYLVASGSDDAPASAGATVKPVQRSSASIPRLAAIGTIPQLPRAPKPKVVSRPVSSPGASQPVTSAAPVTNVPATNAPSPAPTTAPAPAPKKPSCLGEACGLGE